MDTRVRAFFSPRVVAVVGASSKEKSIGYELLKTIKHYGYKGQVQVVNPKNSEILGYTCFPAVEMLPGVPDLAIVLVPKAAVPATLQSLLDKGCKSIVLITAGFKETGAEGAAMEQEIISKVKAAGARMTGPNCMGVISTFPNIRLNATFVAEEPENNSIAFLSQSGAIGAAVLNTLRDTDNTFGHFVSIGNKADLAENDFLQYWLQEEQIQVVTMYLESFAAGEQLLLTYAGAANPKPLILLKAGRTESGMKAAASHTGALGASDRVVDSLLRQFGIIRADTLQEMFDTAKWCVHAPLPVGNRVAVITNAGGPAILAVDALEQAGLRIAPLGKATMDALRPIVHPEGSIKNPVDLLPGGTAEQYSTCCQLLLADENVDAVVSIFVEPVMVEAFGVVEGLNSIASSKPLYQVCMPLPEFRQLYRQRSAQRKPWFRNPEEPAKVIANLLAIGGGRQPAATRLAPRQTEVALPAAAGFMRQRQVETLCAHYGIPMAGSWHWVASAPVPGSIRFPVALKAEGEGLVHKSELNAVALNLASMEELLAAMQAMRASVAAAGKTVSGWLAQEFVAVKHELLIGGFRDPNFGAVIMFGAGGKYVEAVNDTALRSARLTRADIQAMINETVIGKILAGVRGEAPVNREALITIINGAARLLLDCPRVAEFDINPLAVTSAGLLTALDVRVRLT